MLYTTLNPRLESFYVVVKKTQTERTFWGVVVRWQDDKTSGSERQKSLG